MAAPHVCHRNVGARAAYTCGAKGKRGVAKCDDPETNACEAAQTGLSLKMAMRRPGGTTNGHVGGGVIGARKGERCSPDAPSKTRDNCVHHLRCDLRKSDLPSPFLGITWD